MATTALGDPAPPPGVSFVTLIPTETIPMETSVSHIGDGSLTKSAGIFAEASDSAPTVVASADVLDATSIKVDTSTATTALYRPSLVGLEISPDTADILTSMTKLTTSAPTTFLTRTSAAASTLTSLRQTSTPKPDIKVGPIDLPIFMSLIFFGPFILTFLFWVAYRKTIHKYILSNRAKKEAQVGNTEAEVTRNVENQVKCLIQPPPKMTKEGRSGGIGVAV